MNQFLETFVCEQPAKAGRSNSLGLPRVSVTKTPNLSSFQNDKKRYTGLFCQLRYMWRNQLQVLRAYWRHNKIERGITDTVTVYLFLAKIRCLNFQNAKQRYIIDFPPIYGTFNDNKTKREIPIYRLLSRYTALWQKIRRGFSFCLGFRGRISFLVVAKNPEYKNQVKI